MAMQRGISRKGTAERRRTTGRKAMAGMAAAASLAALACAAPALAQEPFRIGLVALPGEAAGVEGLSDIKAAYSGALGLPVEVMVARDYGALAEAQIAGRLDYAVYSAPAYAAAFARCGCLRPLAAPVDADGTVGLRSVLIVRTGAAAVRGKLAVGPADSLATRLAPLALSSRARAAAAAGRLVEAQSAAEAETMFLEGEVEGFFGWMPARPEGGAQAAAEDPAGGDRVAGGSLARLEAAGLDPASYRVAWRSDVLRYGPHAVRADLPAARADRLGEMLSGIAAGAANPGRRILRGHGDFAAVTQADYAAVVQALGTLAAP